MGVMKRAVKWTSTAWTVDRLESVVWSTLIKKSAVLATSAVAFFAVNSRQPFSSLPAMRDSIRGLSLRKNPGSPIFGSSGVGGAGDLGVILSHLTQIKNCKNAFFTLIILSDVEGLDKL